MGRGPPCVGVTTVSKARTPPGLSMAQKMASAATGSVRWYMTPGT